jgi:hypothetical protein
MNWKCFGRKWLSYKIRYFSSIRLEEMRKFMTVPFSLAGFSAKILSVHPNALGNLLNILLLQLHVNIILLF